MGKKKKNNLNDVGWTQVAGGSDSSSNKKKLTTNTNVEDGDPEPEDGHVKPNAEEPSQLQSDSGTTANPSDVVAPGEEEEEEIWEVKKLLGKRKNKETKEIEYKVLWLGFTEGEYGATTWEPKSWLQEEGYDDILNAYDQVQEEAVTAKKKQNESRTYNGWATTYIPPLFPHPLTHVAVGLLEAAAASVQQENQVKGASSLAYVSKQRRSADIREALVNKFEGLFLLNGNFDPSVLRLLGSAEWDIEKAWTAQQEKYEAGKTIFGEKRQNTDSEDDEEKEEEDDKNFFMVAPTTFFESADILLVIFSYSLSGDFFSASSVSQRWHHVGRKMRRGRGFVRTFCNGIVRSLTMNGVIPISVSSVFSSAGTSTKVLRKIYNDARRELEDPDYDGRNGGTLVPMYQKMYERNPKLLDPKVPLQMKTEGTSEGWTMTLCIGRLPTAASAQNHHLEFVDGGACGFRREDEHVNGSGGWVRCQPHQPDKGVSYVKCNWGRDCAEVLHIKCIAPNTSGDRQKLSRVVQKPDGWRAELPTIAALGPQARNWPQSIVSIPYTGHSAQVKLEGQRKEDELAKELCQLWGDFVWSLPPPAIGFSSFPSFFSQLTSLQRQLLHHLTPKSIETEED